MQELLGFLRNNYIKHENPFGEVTCPCCAYPTLSDRGGFEICILCFWEDDGQDDSDADEIKGGPNSNYSLSESRENFSKFLTGYRQTDVNAFKLDTLFDRDKKLIIEKLESIDISKPIENIIEDCKEIENTLEELNQKIRQRNR